MLKIKLEVEDKYLERFEAMLSLAPQLLAQGIAFDREMETPHLTFTQDALIRAREQQGEFLSAPTIVFERFGCASIDSDYKRQLMANKNVLIWAKETTLREKALFNVPVVDHRYHWNLTPLETDWEVLPTQIDDASLAKIEHIFPIYKQHRFDGLEDVRCPSLSGRANDVLFSGAITYDYPRVTRHRALACEAISQLQGVKRIVGYGRTFKKNLFWDVLSNSKILVSPYGWGEYSWKDYEALFCGTILVKPVCDFVTSYGFDIYQPGLYYEPCRPDFSDLSEVVARILENKEAYAARAQQARADLWGARKDNATFLADLVAFFRKAEQRLALLG